MMHNEHIYAAVNLNHPINLYSQIRAVQKVPSKRGDVITNVPKRQPEVVILLLSPSRKA